MTESSLPPIKLDSFEGPFDLLLELVRSKKVAISGISLSQITDAYITYINEHSLLPSLQADFLVIASTLLLIKVQSLLPNQELDEEGELRELPHRLQIYQLYREQAGWLNGQWDKYPLLSRQFKTMTNTPWPLPIFSADDIAQGFESLLHRLPKPIQPQRHLRPRTRTLNESLHILSQRLQTARKIIFQEEHSSEAAHITAISFLAVLELARRQQVLLQQDKQFEPLVVELIS